MRRAAKVLFTLIVGGFGALILYLSTVAAPQTAVDLATIIFLALTFGALPIFLTVLPWIAIPRPATDPDTITIERSLPALLFRTSLTSLGTAFALLTGAILLGIIAPATAAAIDSGRTGTGISYTAGLLVLITGIAALLHYLLVDRTWRAWRHRHWPLLLIDRHGLGAPDGRRLAGWPEIAGIANTGNDYKTGLSIHGHRQTPGLFYPYPETLAFLDTSLARGTTGSIRDTIVAHPGYQGPG